MNFIDAKGPVELATNIADTKTVQRY